MGKLFVVSIFCLLIPAYGVAGNLLYDSIDMLWEFENLDVAEEAEEELFDVPSWTSRSAKKGFLNVDDFGAVGDGVSDDTQVQIFFLFI